MAFISSFIHDLPISIYDELLKQDTISETTLFSFKTQYIFNINASEQIKTEIGNKCSASNEFEEENQNEHERESHAIVLYLFLRNIIHRSSGE